jgi:hypothetical protein
MVVTPRTQRRHDQDERYDDLRQAALGSGYGEDWTNAVPGRRERQAVAEREAREAMSLGADVSSRMLAGWRAGEEEASRNSALVARSDEDDDDDDDDDMIDSPMTGIHHASSGMTISPSNGAAMHRGPSARAPTLASRPVAMGADDDSDYDSDEDVHFSGPDGILQPHSDADHGEYHF